MKKLHASIYDPTLELPLKDQLAVTVYGASSQHIDNAFVIDAERVGELLAARHATVINGGGANGLMGAVNNGALRAGGRAIGVIPQFMADKGWGHPELTHMQVCPDMHTRKLCMAQNAHAIIALPGGVGTLDELMEIITWRQLKLYSGNIVLLNTMGYYEPLISMLEKAESLGFMRKGQPQRLFAVASTPAEAVQMALNTTF